MLSLFGKADELSHTTAIAAAQGLTLLRHFVISDRGLEAASTKDLQEALVNSVQLTPGFSR